MKLDIPTLSTVKKQFEDLSKIMENCRTVEDARNLENDEGLYIEIGVKGDSYAGHCTMEHYDNVKPEEIEWFRVEYYSNLAYIYFWTDKRRTFFDIYNDDDDYSVLEDVTIDTLKEHYENLLSDFQKKVLAA